MYAVNDTFDDIRDGGTVQNKASTKRNKDKQVLWTFFKRTNFEQNFHSVLLHKKADLKAMYYMNLFLSFIYINHIYN